MGASRPGAIPNCCTYEQVLSIDLERGLGCLGGSVRTRDDPRQVVRIAAFRHHRCSLRRIRGVYAQPCCAREHPVDKRGVQRPCRHRSGWRDQLSGRSKRAFDRREWHVLRGGGVFRSRRGLSGGHHLWRVLASWRGWCRHPRHGDAGQQVGHCTGTAGQRERYRQRCAGLQCAGYAGQRRGDWGRRGCGSGVGNRAGRQCGGLFCSDQWRGHRQWLASQCKEHGGARESGHCIAWRCHCHRVGSHGNERGIHQSGHRQGRKGRRHQRWPGRFHRPWYERSSHRAGFDGGGWANHRQRNEYSGDRQQRDYGICDRGDRFWRQCSGHQSVRPGGRQQHDGVGCRSDRHWHQCGWGVQVQRSGWHCHRRTVVGREWRHIGYCGRPRRYRQWRLRHRPGRCRGERSHGAQRGHRLRRHHGQRGICRRRRRGHRAWPERDRQWRGRHRQWKQCDWYRCACLGR